MVEYTSILDFINYNDPYENPFTPFISDNLPYDIGYGLWEILGGTLAWLINLTIWDTPISLKNSSIPSPEETAIIAYSSLFFGASSFSGSGIKSV